MHLKKPSQLPPRHLQLIPLPHRRPLINKHRYQAVPVIAKGKALKQSDCPGKAARCRSAKPTLCKHGGEAESAARGCGLLKPFGLRNDDKPSQ